MGRADRADKPRRFPRPLGGGSGPGDEIERERVEPPRARPGARIVVHLARIDRRHRLDQNPPACLGRFARRRARRHRPHQPMQPDRLGRDRRIALVDDRLAVDEREGAQRRDRLVEPVVRELGRQRLAEFLPPLGEQEQRDRLGREQRRVDDQRLGGGMQLGGFVDGEREGLRDRQPVVILERRVLFGVEQLSASPRSRLAVVGEARYRAARNRRPPARGRAAGRRAPPTAPRPRRARRRARCARSDSPRRSSFGQSVNSTGAATPRQSGAFEVTSTRAAPPCGRIRLQRVGIGRVVEDKQEALALVAQPLHHRGERRLLLLVRLRPSRAARRARRDRRASSPRSAP